MGAAQYDYIKGGPGNDTVTGGGGYDIASYLEAPSGVSVDLSVTGPQDTHADGFDTISGVESLTGSQQDDSSAATAAAIT